MTAEIFLILNLVLAFYNVGTIWSMEIDIFRTWKLLDPKTFPVVQYTHWKKLPFWIFIPIGLAFAGSVVLLWYRPNNIPMFEIWIVLGFQIISHFLTAVFWGPWQAKLSKDELGSESPFLEKILKTHWIRTALINAYGFMFLLITIQSLK